MALELDDAAFADPDVGGFDPEATGDDVRTTYLSPMEALLLDIAVAPAQSDTPWLTYAQAESVFGDQARRTRQRLNAERRRAAAAGAFAGALGAAVLGLALAWSGTDSVVATCWALTLDLAVASTAMWYARPAVNRRARCDAAGVASITGALCAALNAINQGLSTPLISDAAGLIAGILIVALAGLLWISLTGGDAGRDRVP